MVQSNYLGRHGYPLHLTEAPTIHFHSPQHCAFFRSMQLTWMCYIKVDAAHNRLHLYSLDRLRLNQMATNRLLLHAILQPVCGIVVDIHLRHPQSSISGFVLHASTLVLLHCSIQPGERLGPIVKTDCETSCIVCNATMTGNHQFVTWEIFIKW